jgi:hypothetical protein
MTEAKKPPSRDANFIENLGSAVAEYQRTGQVRNARCEVCHSLIQVKPLGESAWATNCTCGRYRDTIRGL